MTTARLWHAPAVAALLTAGLVATVQAPALAAGPAAPQAAAQTAAQAPGTISSVVSGTWTDAAGRTGTVTGTFDPQRFHRAGNGLAVVGTLRLAVQDAAGSTVRTVTRTVDVPVQTGAAAPAGVAAVTPQALACNILSLDLGPLDLNLLGLRVQLNQINLDITAIPGGGLLGDLLCAVANLLNGGLLGGLLNQVAALLNQILAILPA